jgi:hypothetical protein
MRAAANTIEEFNVGRPEIYHPEAEWGPAGLRREAEHVEAEDREAAERELLVEELAQVIFEGVAPCLLWPGGASSPDTYRQFARSAIDAGWRK